MKCFMVAVFMPVLKLTLGAAWPDHQSHADLPASIHDVSAIFEGGFRLRIMLDSISFPGSSPIMNTRHGLLKGVEVSTAMPGTDLPASFTCGDRSALMLREPNLLFLRRYMPA